MSSPRHGPDDEESLSLAIDMIRCDGHGICAWLFPERISLDRWGYPIVDPSPVTGKAQKQALRAVRACPRAALSAKALSTARADANVQS